MSDWYLEQAKAYLRDNGYVVIPKGRHVVLSSHRVLSPWYSKEAPDGLVDHVYDVMARQIGHQILAAGHCVRREDTINDTVTGLERVLRLSVGIIKPKD